MEDIVQSGNLELDKAIRNWLRWDSPTSESYSLVQELVRKKQWSELSKIMLKRLAFGTAGIRGKMGPGFSAMNDLIIIQTTQGLAKYVLKSFPTPEHAKSAGAVVGFDARHNSLRWAKLTARVFLENGFKVFLFSSITPTPFVPFTVQQKTAAVGVMITASHNPKEDNGYKVFWNNGPQIKPPHDQKILQHISDFLKPESSQAFEDNLSDVDARLIDPLDEMSDSYFSTLKAKLYDVNLNQKLRNKIVYSAMHGVGAAFIDQAFQVASLPGVIHVLEQREPNPDFPTVAFPNPEEGKSSLCLSFATAEDQDAIYILANDPDADRLAVAQKLDDGSWKIFNGNEIGALLGWWQIQTHFKEQGEKYSRNNLYFLASTVSSKILRSMASSEGLSFEETLTGFKWLANRAYDLEQDPNKKVLLAYEEAIGFMCGSQVLDKDGVFAAVRMAELICFLEVQGLTLRHQLQDLYDKYGYHCNRASYVFINDVTVSGQIFHRLRHFDQLPNTYPKTLGGKWTIKSIRDLTTGFDNSQADLKAIFHTDPKSQMITFTFENGVVATLRTSGTEPKLKYYAEYCGKPEQKDWDKIEQELEEIVATLKQDFIQVEKYGLE